MPNVGARWLVAEVLAAQTSRTMSARDGGQPDLGIADGVEGGVCLAHEAVRTYLPGPVSARREASHVAETSLAALALALAHSSYALRAIYVPDDECIWVHTCPEVSAILAPISAGQSIFGLVMASVAKFIGIWFEPHYRPP